MLKKILILTISIFFFAFSAHSGSDGELKLNKNNESKQISDCFERLNRATFAFNHD